MSNCLNYLPQLVIWLLTEVVRLQLGQHGNIQEKVSKLATSMLLSLFPQLPILIYLGSYQEIIFPSEKVFVSILIALDVVQICFALFTLRRFIKEKTRRFYRQCRKEEEDLRKRKEVEEAEVAYWSKCSKEVNFTEKDNS